MAVFRVFFTLARETSMSQLDPFWFINGNKKGPQPVGLFLFHER